MNAGYALTLDRMFMAAIRISWNESRMNGTVENSISIRCGQFFLPLTPHSCSIWCIAAPNSANGRENIHLWRPRNVCKFPKRQSQPSYSAVWDTAIGLVRFSVYCSRALGAASFSARTRMHSDASRKMIPICAKDSSCTTETISAGTNAWWPANAIADIPSKSPRMPQSLPHSATDARAIQSTIIFVEEKSVVFSQKK